MHVDVSILCIGESYEARLCRDCIEALNHSAFIHYIGQPSDFLKLIASPDDLAPVIVISAHGTENGILFGDYCESIDTSMLLDGALPIGAIVATARLSNNIVVSTACQSKPPQDILPQVVKNFGAYIAPDGFPDGHDIGLFLHKLFYEYFVRKQDISNALEKAKPVCHDGRLFTNYGNES